MARVSVIIPCYNTAPFLEDAIRSVLNQSYADFELIIVDDGSTDSTRQIAAGFLSDQRIRYLYQENRGLSAARNIGIALAVGDFVALLDADDIWEPEKLACQVALLCQSREVGMVFSDFSTFDSGGIIACSKIPSLLIETITFSQLFVCNNFIYPSTVVLRKSAFVESGGFDVSLRSIEDYDLWLRIAQRYRIVGINAPLVWIRQHDSNMSGNVPRMLESELEVLEKNCNGLPRRVVRRRRAKTYFLNADRYVHQRKRIEALLLVAKGLITYPFLFVDVTVVLVKLLLGGETVGRLRRKINGNDSLMARLYWGIYNRY